MKKYYINDYSSDMFRMKKSHFVALMKDANWKHERNEILKYWKINNFKNVSGQ